MAAPPAAPAAQPDPTELLRSRAYVVLLAMGAVIGVPIAFVAYFFLKVVAALQEYLYSTLPDELGFDGTPIWWPLPLLALAGLLVALVIRFLPGTGGHRPAEGLKTGVATPIELPGVVLAALATLALGGVLGPEAPLIAIGGGLGLLALGLLRRDAAPQAVAVVGVAGSFAAISTLLGSPLVGAFLLMEAAGIGGPLLGVVLLPGLLAAGVGALIFVGLDDWTGYGTFSLGIPDLPPAETPTVSQFLWAIAIGVAAALLGTAIRRLALALQPVVEQRILLLTPVIGLVVGLCAMAFEQWTDHSSAEVLFSGQDSIGPLLTNAGEWTAGALVLLIVCKGLAYCASLSAFRGGPIFPGMFLGAAGGLALSHLPGMPPIAGAAMGIGALTVAMLGLPLTSVLLATLFLGVDGLPLMPLVIVAVVVSHVASARLAPAKEIVPSG